MSNSQQQRILVVRLGAIGDVLRVLPAVRRLRCERPNATIGWVVENWVYPVVAGNPNVDRFHILDRRQLRGGPATALREVARLARELRSAGYDIALDFHGRLKSGFVSRSSAAPMRIGYARGDASEGNHLFNNVHVRLQDKWENRVLRFLHLLQPLGIDARFDPGDLGVHVTQEEREKACAWHAANGRPAVAAFPGTSRLRSYKRWPAEKWAELLRRLEADGIATVVFWGPDDVDFTGQIAALAGTACTLAPPTRLCEMMAMIGCCRGFIGSNTAAMHMAWLQGVPTAWFPGPGRPRTDAPLGNVRARSLWAGDHYREGLPRQKQPDVVRAVGVDEAVEAVRWILGRG
jgi:ADP-heptose:LPS heptosyltransferase